MLESVGGDAALAGVGSGTCGLLSVGAIGGDLGLGCHDELPSCLHVACGHFAAIDKVAKGFSEFGPRRTGMEGFVRVSGQ